MSAFREIVATPSESTVRIHDGNKEVALGTIVDADGLVVTKGSLLQGTPKVMLKDGRSFVAEFLGVDHDHDLALLKIDATKLKPVTWVDSKDAEAGDWVASVGISRDPVAIGVVSVKARKIEKLAPLRERGYLGVMLSNDQGGLKIEEVMDDTGAKRGGLQAKDVILEVNGKKLQEREELLSLLARRSPGTSVRVLVQRDEKKVELKITLGKRPEAEMPFSRGEFQNQLGSDLSGRRSGFPNVLQHDTVIKPQDCGGPLVSLEGKAVGINVARAGRTESYAIPSNVVQEIVRKLKSTVQKK